MIGRFLNWAGQLLHLSSRPAEPDRVELYREAFAAIKELETPEVYLDREGETLKKRTGKAATIAEPGRAFLSGKEALRSQLSKLEDQE